MGIIFNESFLEKNKVLRLKPIKKLLVVSIHTIDEFHTTKIGTLLFVSDRTKLAKFFKDNMYVFAWLYDEILGVDPEVMVHCLNVCFNISLFNKKGKC